MKLSRERSIVRKWKPSFGSCKGRNAEFSSSIDVFLEDALRVMWGIRSAQVHA
jgi:hypothetical protein